MKIIVLDSETKEAIEEAKVELYLNGQKVASGYTNSDGHFYKEGLEAPAKYVVVVTRSGYKAQEFHIEYDDCVKLQETVKLVKD